MKKLYMAAAALLTFGMASAANLTFYIGDNAVANGEKYIFNEYEWYDYGDGVGEYTIDPHAFLYNEEGGSVTVTAESLDGNSIQLCAGGMCENGTKIVKNVNMSAGEKLNLQFEAMGYVNGEGEAGVPDILARLTADDGDENVSFTIEMGPTASVKRILMDDKAFLLTANGISYNVEGATTASIYDLKGNRVMNANINGQGVLSTAGIPAGVYVYSLTGAVNRTGKIFVR